MRQYASECVYSFNSELNACFDTLIIMPMYIAHADDDADADADVNADADANAHANANGPVLQLSQNSIQSPFPESRWLSGSMDAASACLCQKLFHF